LISSSKNLKNKLTRQITLWMKLKGGGGGRGGVARNRRFKFSLKYKRNYFLYAGLKNIIHNLLH